MKKKLEAELISIAHRILKLKNRSELDQLQKETLKLYEKISVLRFVQDNFGEVKPTIGYMDAEKQLEDAFKFEIENEIVEDKEVENENIQKRDNSKEIKQEKPQQEKISDEDNEPAENEGVDPEQEIEEYSVSEEEKQYTEEETEEPGKETEDAENQSNEEEEIVKSSEDKPEAEAESEKNEIKGAVEIEKPEEELEVIEQAAKTVFKEEQQSSEKEEEKAIDAQTITISPDKTVEIEKETFSFDFAFERKLGEDEEQEKKEISFEDYHDYKDPEFVKIEDFGKGQPETKFEKVPEEKAKEEVKKEKPKSQLSFADTLNKNITLGLNDRIAFEKNLFGGSSEDLNRVLSQLNTLNTYEEAVNFIEDLVKPDYNNWKDKEEYEVRFMEIVEKKFS